MILKDVFMNWWWTTLEGRRGEGSTPKRFIIYPANYGPLSERKRQTGPINIFHGLLGMFNNKKKGKRKEKGPRRCKSSALNENSIDKKPISEHTKAHETLGRIRTSDKAHERWFSIKKTSKPRIKMQISPLHCCIEWNDGFTGDWISDKAFHITGQREKCNCLFKEENVKPSKLKCHFDLPSPCALMGPIELFMMPRVTSIKRGEWGN